MADRTLIGTQYLKSTGILDAYEAIIETIASIEEWEEKEGRRKRKKTIHEIAADMLEDWHKENQDLIQ